MPILLSHPRSIDGCRPLAQLGNWRRVEEREGIAELPPLRPSSVSSPVSSDFHGVCSDASLGNPSTLAFSLSETGKASGAVVRLLLTGSHMDRPVRSIL